MGLVRRQQAGSFRFGRSTRQQPVWLTFLFYFLAGYLHWTLLPAISAQSMDDLVRGRVADVRPERGEARLSVSDGKDLQPNSEGEIMTRQGPVDFLIERISGGDIRIRERRRGDFEKIRVGDLARLYVPASRVLEKAEKSLKEIDQLLETPIEQPPSPLESAPDLLGEVTGDLLLEYEAWLNELEAETLETPSEEEPPPTPRKEKIPFYPNLKVENTIRSGVDINRTVSDTTSEITHGRFILWNYQRRLEWWKDNNSRLENQLEQSNEYLYEELDYRRNTTTWNGDHVWWRNRALIKDYRIEGIDSFFYDDFEARRIHKLSPEWQWQRGIEVETRQEYEAKPNRGYLRLRGISEWNYYDEEDTWLDIGVEITQEVRMSGEDSEQEYTEALLTLHYSTRLGDWDFYVTGREEYRDYNQAENRSDRLASEWFGTLRKELTEKWTGGFQWRIEANNFRYTRDYDSDSLLLELAPTLDYWGDEISLSLSPRLTGKHFFGKVPAGILLFPGSPGNKSEGDWVEAGLYTGLTWTPVPAWRITLSNDIAQRWYPAGETGVTVTYLEAELLADSLNNLASLSVVYQPRREIEISAFVTHSVEVFSQYDENDFSTFDAGIEATYRF